MVLKMTGDYPQCGIFRKGGSAMTLVSMLLNWKLVAALGGVAVALVVVDKMTSDQLTQVMQRFADSAGTVVAAKYSI